MKKQKWEYMIEVDDNFTENLKHMNELGKEGWELISVVYIHVNGKSKYYFKRLLNED